jgi:hypothetical protein
VCLKCPKYRVLKYPTHSNSRMARILALEELNSRLRSELQGCLRVCDEAVVLPSASRSEESGAFKNVVFRLSGTDTELNPELFSPSWFAGVSAVLVAPELAEPLLRKEGKRAEVLKKLASAVMSEMSDAEVQVGPELEGDETDRDTKGWVAGFDSASCCIGLYSARQSRSPDVGASGMNRVHNAYYLVAKCGGGVAAQTFHSRLTSALRSGKSLDECLGDGGSPGIRSLRRVSNAARRARARLLAQASEIMGFATVDTISDNAASPSAPMRGAIPCIDVTYNSLRKIEGTPRSTWQYSSGCVDAVISQGLMTSSNVAEGFVAFTNQNDEFKVAVRNDAYSTIPFVTERLRTTKAISQMIAQEHKKVKGRGQAAHPDSEFISTRFSWKSKNVPGGDGVSIEPPPLWGSHASEAFLASWARELGVANCKVVRMSPEAVCISAMEPAKLRAVVKTVSAG